MAQVFARDRTEYEHRWRPARYDGRGAGYITERYPIQQCEDSVIPAGTRMTGGERGASKAATGGGGGVDEDEDEDEDEDGDGDGDGSRPAPG
ncbi:MAG: hypothetical protein D8M59_04205 [Planctomycetes bacterium]|nr:hypothetical protein [Planctomycetota bacterium]